MMPARVAPSRTGRCRQPRALHLGPGVGGGGGRGDAGGVRGHDVLDEHRTRVAGVGGWRAPSGAAWAPGYSWAMALGAAGSVNREDQDLLGQLLDACGSIGAPRAALEAVVEVGQRPAGRHALRALWRHGLTASGPRACAQRRRAEPARPGAPGQPHRGGAGSDLATHLLQAGAPTGRHAALEAAGVAIRLLQGAAPASGPLRPTRRFGPWRTSTSSCRASAATEALLRSGGSGFAGRPSPATVSHEVALRGHGVELDVHWEPLPARAGPRSPWARHCSPSGSAGELVGPDDVATRLWLLLVHPAFTEHVTLAPRRAVDLDRWVRSRTVPWADAAGAPEVAPGLRPRPGSWRQWTQAGWARPCPTGSVERSRPAPARRAYLRAGSGRTRRRRFRAASDAGPRRLRLGGRRTRPADVVRAVARAGAGRGARRAGTARACRRRSRCPAPRAPPLAFVGRCGSVAPAVVASRSAGSTGSSSHRTRGAPGRPG